jgi:hypothetical protein
MMKATAAVVSLSLAVAVALSAHADTSPVALHIDAPATVQSGAAIEVGITLVNLSQEPLDLRVGMGGQTAAERTFQISVSDQLGLLVPRTPYGLALLGKGYPITVIEVQRQSYTDHVIEPNGELKESSVVNSLFEMTAPGTYYITVSRKMRELGGRTVRSNVALVTVTK